MIEITDFTNKIASVELLCKLLGDRLKRARLQKNITQAELSKKTGVSREKIINAERGFATTPTLAAMIVSLDLDSDLQRALSYEHEIYIEPKKIKMPKPRQRASGVRIIDDSNEPE